MAISCSIYILFLPMLKCGENNFDLMGQVSCSVSKIHFYFYRMPASWQPKNHLFALENGFWKARRKLKFTKHDIRNIGSTNDPIFQEIRKLTVCTLYAPSSIKSGGFLETFSDDLLQYIRNNLDGNIC